MATKLDLADSQFIGFHFGKREPGVVGLVESMGMTRAEWMKWKTNYETYYLTDSEVEEIDEYFEKSGSSHNKENGT